MKRVYTSDQAMSRRVRQRVEEHGNDKVGSPSFLPFGDDGSAPKVQESFDWTSLTHDLMLHVFTLLDTTDRASLASTCPTWRSLGASPYLWSSLDLRAKKFDISMADSLAKRCGDLHKVRFRGLDAAAAICNLKAKNLKEITGDSCENMTNAMLSMIAARHGDLESLHLGSCERITTEAIEVVAFCCPKLKKLRLSGMRDVSSEAITALAKYCPQLIDVGFLDCGKIDEEALGKLVSVRYLSITGTAKMNWLVATESLEKLPNITGLDVSRTNIPHAAVSRLLKTSQSLKVMCALNCPLLELHSDFNPGRFTGKLLIAMFNNALNGMASIFEVNSVMPKEAMHWLEWILSHTLLLLAEGNKLGVNNFWHMHGGKFFLRLMQSSQEDVQERGATGLTAFLHVGDDHTAIYSERANTFKLDGGIPVLLKLAGSLKEGLQIEASKAIAHLSLNVNVAKAVAEEGGVNVLLGLAKSRNRLVAEEAAGALWNLSLGDPYKAIAEAGGINVLVELLFRWPYGYGRLLERAAGAIANLAGDDKCSMEVANAGGVHALVMIIRNCNYEGAQEHAARGLANIAGHDDSNINIAAIGQEPGALETLLQLTKSQHAGVKQEAAGALWNLAYDDTNRALITALGGVEALVELARSSSNAPSSLQERAAGALWGLVQSEENSIAIGNQGGIPALLALGQFNDEAVHVTVTGALWNLSFNNRNALRIVEAAGVKTLGRLCSHSDSKLARFLASLALACIFDGRLDQNRSRSLGLAYVRRSTLRGVESFITDFIDPQIFESDDVSSMTPSMLAPVLEKMRIPEADVLKCSREEIGRFVAMLGSPCYALKKFAAFALIQFTIPGASHAKHHASLMQNARDVGILRSAAAATSMTREAEIFAKIVQCNLKHHQPE